MAIMRKDRREKNLPRTGAGRMEKGGCGRCGGDGAAICGWCGVHGSRAGSADYSGNGDGQSPSIAEKTTPSQKAFSIFSAVPRKTMKTMNL